MRIFPAIAAIVVLYAQLVCSAVELQPLEWRDRSAVPTDSDATLVKYYVYTRYNRATPQALEPDVESVVRNVFDPLKPTTISVHGYGGSKDAAENAVIVATKLDQEDGNVIVVDWYKLTPQNSEEALAVTKIVGAQIADLVALLHRHFLVRLELIHLVGFSMGAQIAGLAGQGVYERLGMRVERVTGLDPAGGFFNELAAHERLSADDAQFVDVIHTSAGIVGYEAPCGHADFYPNGGRTQPNCADNDLNCSHLRAFQLVSEMWLPENEFVAMKCASATDMSLERCTWVNVRMGENVVQKGVYYLETNGMPPYAKGSFVFAFL